MKDRRSKVRLCKCGRSYIKVRPDLFKFEGKQKYCLNCHKGKHADFTQDFHTRDYISR